MNQCCIFIMSYELAAKKDQELQKHNFNMCIADETHYLKSRDTKRSKALVPILQQSKRVLLLSGTPVLAKPCEIYNILKIIRPDICPSWMDFSQRYCDPKDTRYGKDYSGATCTKELHYLL